MAFISFPSALKICRAMDDLAHEMLKPYLQEEKAEENKLLTIETVVEIARETARQIDCLKLLDTHLSVIAELINREIDDLPEGTGGPMEIVTREMQKVALPPIAENFSSLKTLPEALLPSFLAMLEMIRQRAQATAVQLKNLLHSTSNESIRSLSKEGQNVWLAE